MLVVNYHEISAGSASRHRYALSREAFEAQLGVLIDAGFSFGTLGELLDAPAGDDSRRCAITFDDGRLGAYDPGLAILAERAIQATYFLCSDWLDKRHVPPREAYSDFMTWDHAADVARHGHLIGSHGKRHRAFFYMDRQSAVEEVTESKRLIEQRLGVSCEHFASPWGQIDRAVMNLVQASGYTSLASTVRGANKAPYNRFRLRRLDGADFDEIPRFSSAIRGYVDAHSRFEIGMLRVRGSVDRSWPEIEDIARVDVVVCLDEASYELCLEAGIPCLRPPVRPAPSVERLGDWLLNDHRELVQDRTMTFTPLSLRGPGWPWKYLWSFRPGMSRRSSATRISTGQ